MKTPTIEEVKAYFKNAKEVKGNFKKFDISKVLDTLYKVNGCYWVILENDYSAIVWGHDNGYAKIISYKSNPNIDLSKLTPELINELSRDENVKQILINNGVIKNELEVGKWYKFQEKNADWWLGCIADSDLKYYGFNSNKWFNKTKVPLINQKYQSYTLATPQEVETALKNEIWKQFKIGDKIKCVNGTTATIEGDIIHFENNVVLLGDERYRYELFNNGKFAQVITEPKKEETYIKVPLSIITLTESDKKLGALVRSISEKY
jgi:hypothetical protein